jgi:glycosyltransferase involved in cell wall biosynthesis
MHILIVHQAFAALDEAGGTRHYELARYLINRGHRVTVIASPVSYLTGKTQSRSNHWVERVDKGQGLTIFRTYTYTGLHRSFVLRVFSFLSFMLSSFFVGLGVPKVDLVWGTSPPLFQGGTAWALARLKRAPFLFEVRDLWPAFAIQVGVLRNPFLIRLSEWFESFLYQHANRVMVNSPGFIEHVQKRGAGNVYLLPNGADPEMFDPNASGEEFRSKHHLVDKFVVLYAGAHGLSNDLGVVLEAASQLKCHPEIQFVFVGDGKEKRSLVAQAARMNLTNTTFLDPAPKQDMPGVLAAADACIAILKPIPLYATTYPNKVFDYMAAGRPVILAIDGVIRKVVEEAGAGIAIPPGDSTAMANAVRQMALRRSAARAMGLAGRQYVERYFSRPIIAARLVELLDEMRCENG